MNNKVIKVFGFLIFVFGVVLMISSSKLSMAAPVSTGTNHLPNTDKQNLKVLVIEINPILYSVTNSSLYSNNNGHPKISEFFNQDLNLALNEMVKDLEDSSHNYLSVTLNKEYLDEFMTYKEDITLLDGRTSRRVDEESFLLSSRIDGEDRGDWYKYISSDLARDLYSNHNYSFDYSYIIEKFNLLDRRRNNEFDQVWLLTADPALTYETIMIGNKPFWINAPGYVADCQNFPIVNVSISRRDANFHALGHGVEGIMNAIFYRTYDVSTDYTGTGTYNYYKTMYNSYGSDEINVSDMSSYNKLNLWEKFVLGNKNNSSGLTSVGNVHLTFNGRNDYDYSNTEKVLTNWRDWMNYPNITGNFVLDNNDAWLMNFGNDELIRRNNNGEDVNADFDRLYMRFWFSLMPHINGYTEDGYLNNWWKYFYSLDFVESIEKTTDDVKINSNDRPQYTLKFERGAYVNVDSFIVYNSGKRVHLEYIEKDNNVHIQDDGILEYKNGFLFCKELGKTSFSISFDGKSVYYIVNVVTTDNFNVGTVVDESSNDKTNIDIGFTNYIGNTNQCLDKSLFQVVNNDDEVVFEWTYNCDNDQDNVVSLPPGSYILKVSQQADGYSTPKMMPFKVDETSKTYNVINNPITVCFSFEDYENINSTYKLGMYKDNNLIQEFELSNEQKCLSQVTAGNYVIKLIDGNSNIVIPDSFIEVLDNSNTQYYVINNPLHGEIVNVPKTDLDVSMIIKMISVLFMIGGFTIIIFNQKIKFN